MKPIFIPSITLAGLLEDTIEIAHTSVTERCPHCGNNVVYPLMVHQQDAEYMQDLIKMAERYLKGTDALSSMMAAIKAQAYIAMQRRNRCGSASVLRLHSITDAFRGFVMNTMSLAAIGKTGLMQGMHQSRISHKKRAVFAHSMFDVFYGCAIGKTQTDAVPASADAHQCKLMHGVYPL